MKRKPPRIVLSLLLAIMLAVVTCVGVRAGPAAAESSAAKVKRLMTKVLKAKNPKKTYNALSKSDKALIKKELTGGARKTRILGGTSANATMNSATPQNSSGTCWSKGIEASRWGGITKAKLLSVTITTRVCVASGAVTSVEVSEAFQTVYSAALGWHKNGVSDSSLNAGWEGRGVGRGEFTWGAGDWDLLFTTVCGQMRLNADMVHYAGSDSCSVSG